MRIFNCQNCTHAELENEVQVGCQLGLLKAHNPVDINDGYFDLDRVCMSKSDSVSNIPFGYIFILKDISKKDQLISNIKLIKDTNPVWIGISCDFPELGEWITKELSVMMPDIKFNLVCHYNEIDDFAKLDRYKKDLKNAWTYVNIVGDYFNHNVKSDVTNFIIKKAGSAGIIKDNADEKDENVNNLCFFNIFYTFLKGSIPEVDEENDLITIKTFYEKVYEKDPNMIKTWRDVCDQQLF
jgi:hypothetical protein